MWVPFLTNSAKLFGCELYERAALPDASYFYVHHLNIVQITTTNKIQQDAQ
jgi:hypothetical protein